MNLNEVRSLLYRLGAAEKSACEGLRPDRMPVYGAELRKKPRA
jgi:hypothetical protein